MIGTVLGPYRVERELGSGGMGKVYSAVVTDRGTGLDEGTTVAIKVVHPHLLEKPGFFKRFLREAEIGRAIVHENVVRTYDCDQVLADGGMQSFLSMEYVEGQTLRELQKEMGLVPEELCRHIGREVAKGLAAIHGAGVIHRDMKPENVLITEDHVVKVMDLGVARLMDEAIRLSRTGVFVGSALSSAPEQFTGGVIDGRADLFSLGTLLYELSTGEHPHPGNNFGQVMLKVIEATPRPIGDRNPQLSPFFEQVVHRLLAKEPEGRFADAGELLAVLEEGEDSAWWHQQARTIQSVTCRPLRRIRIPRETAVYGREKELDLLSGQFEKAKSGEGRVVLIEGEAGIGKSRLVDELVTRLHRDGEDLNFLFGSYPPNGAATAAGAFSSAYREQFGEAGSAGYLTETPLLVPCFDALLSGDVARSDAEPLTRESLQTCFVNATRSLAEERPTVVLIDDLHFGPEEARALFTSLAMAVPGHRVLLIGTTRPGATEDWQVGLDRFEHVSRLAPPRLSARDLAKLLEDAFHSHELAETLGYRIIVKSDGNPFFAFEILRGLREGRFITQKDDGTWVTTQVIEEIEIPSSVLDLVNARVSELSEEERDLLDVACCWGFEFDPALVGEVIGLARIPTLKRFGQIERRYRLVRSAGRNYVFDHHQVQEALYGSLNAQLREEYHAALAGTLEARAGAAGREPETLDGALCVGLCEHYLVGARGDFALRYLEAAQGHLTKNHLHAEFAALTERALDVPDLLTGLERAKVLLGLASALDSLGRRARQEECAREAGRIAEDTEDEEVLGRSARALGDVLWCTSRHEEAETAYRRALRIAVSRGDRKEEADTTGLLGNVFHSQGRLDEAQEQFERHLALSREIGDRRGEAGSTGNLGYVLSDMGRLDEARELCERYLALSREIGNRRAQAGAMGNLGRVLMSQGHPQEAQGHFERCLALSREIGNREVETITTGNLGGVLMALGRLPEAREQFERYLALCREIRHRAGEAYALHHLGNLSSEEQEYALAEEHLAECLVIGEEIGLGLVVASAHVQLGSVRAETGDADGARESLSAGRDLAAKIGLPGIETVARGRLACLPGGDPQDALAALEENEDRIGGGDRILARWLLFQATGERPHLEEARRLLDEEVAQVDDESRGSMLENIRLNREIVAACEEAGL